MDEELGQRPKKTLGLVADLQAQINNLADRVQGLESLVKPKAKPQKKSESV